MTAQKILQSINLLLFRQYIWTQTTYSEFSPMCNVRKYFLTLFLNCKFGLSDKIFSANNRQTHREEQRSSRNPDTRNKIYWS